MMVDTLTEDQRTKLKTEASAMFQKVFGLNKPTEDELISLVICALLFSDDVKQSFEQVLSQVSKGVYIIKGKDAAENLNTEDIYKLMINSLQITIAGANLMSIGGMN